MKTKLILSNLWQPPKDGKPEREWDCQVVDGLFVMPYKDFVEALEITKGTFNCTLRLRTANDKDLRTAEQLEQAKNG